MREPKYSNLHNLIALGKSGTMQNESGWGHPDDVVPSWPFVQSELAKRREEIPPRFRTASTPIPIPDNGVYLFGNVGTGKSYRAAAWANQAIDAGLHVAWIQTAAWLQAKRASFDGGEPPYTADEISNADIVVLDDIGSEKAGTWAIEQLLLLVDACYLVDTQVICTSNARLGALRKHLGERTASRLAEMCQPLEITGTDRRLVIAQERPE